MKKITLFTTLLLLTLMLMAFCVACENEETSELTQANFFAMDTYMTVTLSQGNTAALKEIQEYVLEMDSKWSNTDNNSEISQLNLAKSASLTTETLNILNLSKEFSKKTDGIFDITIYPIVKAWGFTTSTYQVPSEESINELLPLVNYENINIDENLVQLENNAEVTLGGIAKGYIADEIVSILKSYDITSAILDLGGNIQAIGAKDDVSPWSLGVKNPQNDDIIGIVQGIDKAIVTSSSAERYFVYEGKTYSHIINPNTGYPVDNEILSVSIIAQSGAYADMLSTALFVMGVDDAIAFWQQYQDFDMLIMTKDDLYISKSLVDDFELTDTSLSLQVIE